MGGHRAVCPGLGPVLRGCCPRGGSSPAPLSFGSTPVPAAVGPGPLGGPLGPQGAVPLQCQRAWGAERHGRGRPAFISVPSGEPRRQPGAQNLAGITQWALGCAPSGLLGALPLLSRANLGIHVSEQNIEKGAAAHFRRLPLAAHRGHSCPRI